MLWAFLALITVLLLLFYKWSTATYKTFEQRGIPYKKPYPLFGNNVGMFQKKYSLVKDFIRMYQENKHHKIFGFYNMRQPFYILHCPEYIKKICIKDFEYFPNHNPFFQTNNEPLMTNMVMNLKDQAWKDMRTTLTPAFTASKMRAMFTLMEESFEQCLANLKTLSKNGQPFDLEMKEYFSRLSNDVIASTAFGLKINSYAEPDNKFFKIGQSITNFKGKTILKMTINTVSPWLSQVLGLKMFDAEMTEYFTRLVCDAMKYRKENNIVRPDMIQLLMDAQQESSRKWDDIDLVAQCFIFFFAAFENNANLISITCMELMYNPDVQQRLYEEVLETHKELNGTQLNYDVINKMKYLDMVVSETLRKTSLTIVTDRVCARDYKLYDDDGNFVIEFKRGDIIWLPMLGLAWDDEYFENPSEFNPERFNDENKHNIRPCTYIPFGVGPRNCIGNRYALMQAKAMLFHLVLNYKFEKTKKTPPTLLDCSTGFTAVSKNCWVSFVPRQSD